VSMNLLSTLDRICIQMPMSKKHILFLLFSMHAIPLDKQAPQLTKRHC
jgi:hypothetical protein